MRELTFTSILDRSYQESLERVLFLNGNQEKVSEGALLVVERYDTPRISAAKDRLWVTFDSGVEAQSLFVLEQTGAKPRLVGAVVYTRENQVMDVLFLAVQEDYAHGGTKADQNLFFSILNEVRGIAHRIKGVSSLRLYLANPPITISVPRAKLPTDRGSGALSITA